MTHKTYTTKQFISEFNFAEPDWGSLPPNLPKIPKDGLTREESHLLDAIKLAYFATAGGWKKSAQKGARMGFAFIIGLISLIGSAILVTRSAGEQFAQPVQAATHTVNQVIESTMSAILKR